MISLFREETSNWFKDWKFHRPVFFTGVLNNRLGYGEGERNDYEIRKNNKHFVNELHRRVFKKSKNKITRLVIIEKGKGRNHSHIVLETPIHLSGDSYKSIVSNSWLKTRNGISTDFRDVYDINGLRKYLSKEICRKSELGVDIENCHKTIS